MEHRRPPGLGCPRARSSQSQKVLLAALAHITDKRKLARLQPISLERVQRAASDVDQAISTLGPLLDEVVKEVLAESSSSDEDIGGEPGAGGSSAPPANTGEGE